MTKFVNVRTMTKEVRTTKGKETILFVYPTYSVYGNDLMKRGGKFYAVLDHETGMWSTDEFDLVPFVDRETKKYIQSNFSNDADGVYRDSDGHKVWPEYLADSQTNRLKEFNVWMSNLSPNHHYIQLDTELTFLSDKITPEMHRSKRLSYDIKEGSTYAYDKLIKKLYSQEDQDKIEWSVGAILAGESKSVEKFLVLYGKPGSGKSTILDLIKALFEPYWMPFDAAELVNKTSQFGTALLKDNPLVAIQDDGSLAKIEKPIINEIVSHKEIIINEKGKQQYHIKSNMFLILATNDPVDIHDTKLGVARRLLDVYPTGNKIPVSEYFELLGMLKFELPAIAYKCLSVFKRLGVHYYEQYVPEKMILKTNYMRNFLFDKYDTLLADKEYVMRDELYTRYKEYCEESGLGYPPKRIIFGEQLKEYFDEYDPIKKVNGQTRRHVFSGLKVDKVFGSESIHRESEHGWVIFDSEESIFDKEFADCPAQYATKEGTPRCKWSNCKTKLKDLDTRNLHWMKLPQNVIKIDFDKKDAEGNKSLEENIKAANSFTPTYAEVSKSGCGVHLYYIYDGDVSALSRIYEEGIEVKVSTGDNSHRRIFTKCCNNPIATISTGLPLKGGKPVIDEKIAITEKGLRTTILKCLAKEIHGDTRSNIDWIYKILNDAYDSGVIFDVSDLRNEVLNFAINSTNQSQYCVNKVSEMHFKSEESKNEATVNRYSDESPIIFFDFEVFPNLVLLCYKEQGEGKPINRLFNPTPDQIAEVFGIGSSSPPKCIGYNNKEYDNHIAYAIWLGKSTYEVFLTSQAIINKDKSAQFREARNLSFTDIFDYSPEKISLKKWENRLKVHHQELGLKWDEPVDVKWWPLIAEYCCYDVLATEAVFEATKPYYKGRLILCDLANIIMGPGSTPNDSTNDLTTKLIVGNAKNPQELFVYPDLSKTFPGYEFDVYGIDQDRYISKDVIISGKSIYKGFDPGEGGFVYAVPGMYGVSESWDSSSHHPSSLCAENGFGPYTKNFKLILELRLMVKHKEYDKLRTMFDGALAKYLETDEDADALSFALKIAINSVYGLTAAHFKNRLRDPRNIDNWVAKRGALFMIDLMLNVKAMGYTVIHCKTDSIKILNPDDRVRNYICDFGKQYGYTFELEHRFERICLVNDAVYICKYTDEECNKEKERGKWSATGKQFQVPYVFKTLFSHEPIEFDDLCEMKNSTSALYLDFDENLPEGEHDYQFIGKTGLFCPVVDGVGGGRLLREKNGKYSYAGSAKGYRWLESEIVQKEGKEDKIDRSYYISQVDKAVETISKFGDFERFVSDAPYVDFSNFMNVPEGVDEEIELPWAVDDHIAV